MKIRGQDIEIEAGSGESLTYIRYDRTYNDEGVLSPKVKGSFTSEDVITFTLYSSSEDNFPIVQKDFMIIDGKATLNILDTDTSTLEPKTYIYDVFWKHALDEPVCLVTPHNFEIIYTSKTNLGS